MEKSSLSAAIPVCVCGNFVLSDTDFLIEKRTFDYRAFDLRNDRG